MLQSHFKKKYLKPCNLNANIDLKPLVHATPTIKVFKKVINDGQISIPAENGKLKRKDISMDALVGVDHCCFFSAGFDYNAKHHHYPVSFLFRKSLLAKEHFKTFKTYPVARGWKVLLRHLRKNLPEVYATLKKKVPDRIAYFEERDHAGLFFMYEDLLIWALNQLKSKRKLKKEIDEFLKPYILSNSYAPKYASQHYNDHWNLKEIEIVSKKSIRLDSKEFLGFYIKKEHIKDLVPYLKERFDGNKIVYDGKNINKLKEFK